MKKFILSITLLISGTLYTPLINGISLTCPCVNKELAGPCCCASSGNPCNCREMFEKNGSVPSSCQCPKTEAAPELTNALSVAISYGELFDKVTILEIKAHQITDTDKLRHVTIELTALNTILNTVLEKNSAEKKRLLSLKNELASINWEIWKIENLLRKKEKLQQFDAEFITLARSVYTLNDQRAVVKKSISKILDSHIVEEKSYAIIEN